MLWVFSEGAWETLLATVKIMDAIPSSRLTPARIGAGFKAFRGPLILGRRMSAAARCRGQSLCMRQPDQALRLRGNDRWKVAATWLKPPGAK